MLTRFFVWSCHKMGKYLTCSFFSRFHRFLTVKYQQKFMSDSPRSKMSHRILSDAFQTDRILSTWVGIPALGNRSKFILNPTKNRQQKTIFLSVFCRIQDKFRSVSERQDFDGSILDLVEPSPNPTGIVWESDRIQHDSVIGRFDLGGFSIL